MMVVAKTRSFRWEGTYLVGSLRGGRRWRPRVRVGAPDPSLTSVSGLVAVTELVQRLGVVESLDAAVGPIKRHDRGVAYNEQGQRGGGPHVATWAGVESVLAAELLSGNDEPRASAAELFRRALAALPEPARQGRVRLRADAGYFAGELARVAFFADVEFAIGAKRIAPLWRLLDGLTDDSWTDAIDMTGAQVAVAGYRPDWWPANTFLLIRRVRLDVGQVSADPRSRRRRTLHPDQRALPFPELAVEPAIYGYSFILTNLDVSTPDKVAAADGRGHSD